MRVHVGIGVVALLAVGVVACNDGSSGDSADPGTGVTESTENDDRADGTAESVPSVGSVEDSGTPAGWELRSSLTGELDQVVSWSEGFAAVMKTGGDEPPGEGGELWLSEDGVDWQASGPFGPQGDIDAVVGQDDQLFAVSGDAYEDGNPQTLWRLRSGEPWEELMIDDALSGIAVNSERLIAYSWDPFGVLGVFDTATMEEVEFLDVSESLPTEEQMYGDVMALDDGFLATARWPIHLDADADPILLHSADGSAWDQHPSPPEGGIGNTVRQPTVPTFDGRNLVGSFSMSFPPRGGAWVTDSGMTFEPLPDPVTDEVVNPAPAAYLVELTNGTIAGFFGVEDGIIYRSLDGLDWTILESPATWSVLASIDQRGLAHGTILATDDSLIAVGVHGEIEGFTGLVNPNTDIWVTER